MANNFENPEIFAEIAQQAAERYPFEAPAVKLLTFSENATYLVFNPHTQEKYCVLRVGRPGYHTLEEYESEISWLRQINDYTPLWLPTRFQLQMAVSFSRFPTKLLPPLIFA